MISSLLYYVYNVLVYLFVKPNDQIRRKLWQCIMTHRYILHEYEENKIFSALKNQLSNKYILNQLITLKESCNGYFRI